MKYEKLDQEDFDAIVTGELTHFALRMENEINNLIGKYFVKEKSKKDDFLRLILYRDGLTFQDKIEITRGMIPLFKMNKKSEKEFKDVLKNVEDFKSWRNTMAHGYDKTPEKYEQKLIIEIVSRSGKAKTVEITPDSHRKKIDEAYELELTLKKVINDILKK